MRVNNQIDFNKTVFQYKDVEQRPVEGRKGEVADAKRVAKAHPWRR